MTMVADRGAQNETDTEAGDETGQSLIEFMILLPAMVGMMLLMIRTDSAIQTAIVDQQYGRSQELFLAFNSPVYPESTNQAQTQMVMGVSSNLGPDPEEDSSSKYALQAPIQDISRVVGRNPGNDDPGTENQPRTKVRIRNTVTLCTQNNYAQGALKDSTRFTYCLGTQAYE